MALNLEFVTKNSFSHEDEVQNAHHSDRILTCSIHFMINHSRSAHEVIEDEQVSTS